MSTAEKSSSERWPRIGHHAWKIEIFSCIPIIASVWLPQGATVTWVIAIFGVSLFLFAWFTQRKHDRSLCEPCLTDSPLDPQRAIDKHKRALRSVHWHQDHRWTFFAGWILIYGLTMTPRPWGSLAYTITVLVFVVAVAYVNHVHKNLEPWCPQCRDGGGDDYHFNPDPTPTPSRTKELT